MKKYIQLLFFTLLTLPVFGQEDFRENAPKPGPAPKITIGNAEQVTFKNGLKVIVVENHKLPVLNVQLFVNYPPILEGPSAGYIDLAGKMLNKGTTNRSKSDIDEAVDFIGASLSTSDDGVSGSCLTKHMDAFMEIFTDVLFNPSFPADEFEKLKKKTIAELAQAKDDPETIAANVSTRIRNGINHPYGEIPTEATLEGIELEECINFYKTYFEPGSSFLIITGDIKKQDALDMASKYFSNWEKKQVSRPQFEVPQRPAATTVNVVNKVGAVQSVINVTYPIELKPGKPDVIKLAVLNTLLGGYFGSRLNTNLREDNAFTYGANSTIKYDPLVGHFMAYASVRNEVTDSAIVEFLHEMERLQTERVPEEELQMVKNYLTGSFARQLENPQTIALFTLNTARYGLPRDYYSTYLEKIQAVTGNDIQALARQYLTPGQAHIVVVGNKDEVAEKLLPFSKEGKINYYDVYGNLQEEVSMPIPAGVTGPKVIADYLDAIGGMDKLNKINNVIIVMNADIQNMTIESVLYHTAPNKLSLSNSMMGNIVSQSIYDGEKGVVINMGATAPMEEQRLADMKVDARIFPERFYEKLGVQTTLKGIELVNGSEAYRIDILYPSGTKKTNYFDTATKLKIREVDYQDGRVITKDIGDYKEVDGIKIPHLNSVSGAMPIPLELKMTEVLINTEISDELYRVSN